MLGEASWAKSSLLPELRGSRKNSAPGLRLNVRAALSRAKTVPAQVPCVDRELEMPGPHPEACPYLPNSSGLPEWVIEGRVSTGKN